MKLSLVCIFVFEKKCFLEKDHSKVNVNYLPDKTITLSGCSGCNNIFPGFFWGGDLHIPCIVDMEK